MPGQPLSTFKGVKDFQFGPGALQQRPELAKFVAFVVEIWSSAEIRTFGMVANLLQQEPIIATAMLQAIENAQAQRDAVVAGAKAILTENDGRLFVAAFDSTKPSRNVRNRFVHHVWGVTDQLPDALLLHDPKYFHVDRSVAIKRVRDISNAPVVKVVFSPDELNRDGMSVWRMSDVLKEVNEATRALRIMAILERLILFRVCNQPTDSIRSLLLNDPTTRQRFDKMSSRASDEAPQAVQPPDDQTKSS